MNKKEGIDASLISKEAERQFCKRLINIIIDEFTAYYPNHDSFKEMKSMLENITIDTVMIHLVAKEGAVLKINNLSVNMYYLMQGLEDTITYMEKTILLSQLGLSEQELLDLSFRESRESDKEFKRRFVK